MLGEFVDILKLLLDMYKGNVPIAQVYTVIGVIVGVAIINIVTDFAKYKRTRSPIKVIFASVMISIIGFTLYIGAYMFLLKILSSLINGIAILSNETLIWFSIVSYIAFITLFALFFLYHKASNIMIKISILLIHVVLTALLLNLINRILNVELDLPLSVYLFTVLLNTILSIFFITYGTDPTLIKKADQEESKSPYPL